MAKHCLAEALPLCAVNAYNYPPPNPQTQWHPQQQQHAVPGQSQWQAQPAVYQNGNANQPQAYNSQAGMPGASEYSTQYTARINASPYSSNQSYQGASDPPLPTGDYPRSDLASTGQPPSTSYAPPSMLFPSNSQTTPSNYIVPPSPITSQQPYNPYLATPAAADWAQPNSHPGADAYINNPYQAGPAYAAASYPSAGYSSGYQPPTTSYSASSYHTGAGLASTQAPYASSASYGASLSYGAAPPYGSAYHASNAHDTNTAYAASAAYAPTSACTGGASYEAASAHSTTVPYGTSVAASYGGTAVQDSSTAYVPSAAAYNPGLAYQAGPEAVVLAPAPAKDVYAYQPAQAAYHAGPVLNAASEQAVQHSLYSAPLQSREHSQGFIPPTPDVQSGVPSANSTEVLDPSMQVLICRIFTFKTVL